MALKAINHRTPGFNVLIHFGQIILEVVCNELERARRAAEASWKVLQSSRGEMVRTVGRKL